MPVDFGLQLGSFPPDGRGDILAWYRGEIESLPPSFTTIWISDHLQSGDSPVLESWTWLTWLAAMFPHMKVGHLVLGQGYRNPALLAKMGATLQILSGGRFILGIGAGWAEEEYRAYGYGYPSRRDRVEQLEEAVQIIRSMWTQDETTFQGKHYSVEGARCDPRPDPVPPILIGSPGPRVIRIAARLADGWSWDGPMSVYGPPHAVLMDACAELGRDPDTVWKTASIDVDLPDDPATFVATYEHSYYPGTELGIIGPTPVDAIAQLRPMIDLGVRHIMVGPSTPETLRRFCAEVVPVLAST